MTYITEQKVAADHWDAAWARPPRMRLPSPLFVGTRNRMRLLKSFVKPGARLLEIGCAPGKLLAYSAKILGAEVAGIDYSATGIGWARQLFEVLRISGDLRCEDAFACTFPPATFDVVHSAGLIEHFDDPRGIVEVHLRLLKPGGIALITVPKFNGFYKKLARFCDPSNLGIHNLEIMDCAALARLVSPELASEVRAWPAGRLCLSAINIHNKLPGPLAEIVQQAANCVGLVQPIDFSPLCPQLVLKAVRR